MNFLKVLNVKIPYKSFYYFITKPGHKRSISFSNISLSFNDYDHLNENIYWDNLKSQIERTNLNIKKQIDIENRKNVFILQLRMQYKSKSRQSTSPELQLAESVSLVETLDNWNVIQTHIVGTKKSYSSEIFGSGNQDLLSKKISSSGANCLFVVIDRLTNLQTDSLRKTLLGNSSNILIYDRYKIVLEIFKQNAKSSIAKLQIALAEIPYLRHKYENNDLYKNVEKKIRKELDLKLKTRSLTNTNRRDKQIPLISVFGYTNAGKTSFIKYLTQDQKLEPKNQLFATLDITYHGTSFFNSPTKNVIFADTIGFISDIPTNLIEAFKTSILDALDADLYIHLVDASNPDFKSQKNTVEQTIQNLIGTNRMNENMITIYNKCDKINNLQEQFKDNLMISCKTGFGLNQVKSVLEKKLFQKLGLIELSLRIEQGSAELAFLYKNSIIKNISHISDISDIDSQFVKVDVLLNKQQSLKLINLFPNLKLIK